MQARSEILVGPEAIHNPNYFLGYPSNDPFDTFLSLAKTFERRGLGIRVVEPKIREKASNRPYGSLAIYGTTYQAKRTFEGFLFNNPEMKALSDINLFFGPPSFEGCNEWDENTKRKITALYWVKRTEQTVTNNPEERKSKYDIMRLYMQEAEKALQIPSRGFKKATTLPLFTQEQFQELIKNTVDRNFSISNS